MNFHTKAARNKHIKLLSLTAEQDCPNLGAGVKFSVIFEKKILSKDEFQYSQVCVLKKVHYQKLVTSNTFTK